MSDANHSEPERPRRSRVRRVLRGVAIAGAVLFGLLVLAIAFVHSGPGQRWLTERVRTALAQRVEGRVELASVEAKLFGAVAVRGLVLADPSGAEVVALDELVVRPSFGDLVRGRVVIDRVELRGLRLAIEQHADGSSNLKKLFKPRPASPPGPAKKSRRVVVRAIDLGGITVSLKKPDGSQLLLRDVEIQASLDAVASEKTVSFETSKLGLDLERVTADGTKLAVSDLETGIVAKLVEGTGTVRLQPLSARARIERPGRPAFATPIALGGIDVDVKPGELGAMLARLELGLLLLESLDVRGGYASGALAGEQRATLIGLSLEAAKLNALLGKEAIRENLQLRAGVRGPPEKLVLDLSVDSAGAKLALDGTVDASRLDRPRYDLTLVGTRIETKKLLGGPAPPDVAVERLELGVAGEGAAREQIAAEIRLDLAKTRVGRVTIDGAKLRGRFERGVLTIRELSIDALDQNVRAEGRYVLATRELDAKLTLNGDVGKALAALRRAGVPIKSQLPAGTLRLEPGELQVEAKGRLDDVITLRLPNAKLRVAGGAATIDATLALRRGPPDRDGKRALALDTVDADVRLRRLDLATLAAMRGKRLPGMSGSVDGRVTVRGTRQAPSIDGELSLDTRADGASARTSVVLRARGDRGTQHLAVVADRVRGSSRDRILELDAELPLRLDGKPRLSPGRKLKAKLDLPRRSIRDLLDILPPELRARLKRLPPDAEIEAEVELAGTSDAPQGTFRVSADAALAPTEARQAVELRGRIEPDGLGSRVSTTLDAWVDRRERPAAHAEATARFARSPLVPGGAKRFVWKLDLAVPDRRIEELPLLGGRGLSGAVGADIALGGTERDVRGDVKLRVADFWRNDLGPLAATLEVNLGDERTNLDLRVRATDFEAARLRGSVAVAGKDLIPTLREKRLGDPALELGLELPRHSFEEWSRLRPKLAELIGDVGGAVRIHGSVKRPLADGAITAEGFGMMGGKPGRAELEIAAGAEQIELDLGLGPRGTDAVSIVVSAKREELIELLRAKQGTRTATVRARARSDSTLADVVPKLTPKLAGLWASGDFDWNMDAELQLESRDGKRALADGVVIGTLAVTRGEVPIPTTKRSYRGVELVIASNKDALTIQKLSLSESDRENKARRLRANGRIAWNRLRPERVKLALHADDWLLFGGDTLGKPDAPRGALSADIDVDGAVGGSVRTIDVMVRRLKLRMPDRFEKAHWPEQTSLGDVVYLGEPGVKLGKLAKPSPAPKPHAAPADPAKVRTLIRIHIPQPIHAQKPPFDMIAKGALDVRIIEGEARPRIQGELSVLSGHMDLGGRDHRIDQRKRSRIYFDDAHPAGELDLYLALPPHPVVLKDVSRASAGGDDVRIHLVGPISKPVSSVTGVGNADLWDILPVHNAGRVKFTSKPDMPASSTAQVPREYDVVLLSYMAANLPHNLILDRLNAWADAYDDRTAYGKIRHLEAERYSESGKTRVRVISRPPTMGQSEAELEAGYLFHNAPRTKAGVGVVAGSRAGGGPALFFEWASDD